MQGFRFLPWKRVAVEDRCRVDEVFGRDIEIAAARFHQCIGPLDMTSEPAPVLALGQNLVASRQMRPGLVEAIELGIESPETGTGMEFKLHLGSVKSCR